MVSQVASRNAASALKRNTSSPNLLLLRRSSSLPSFTAMSAMAGGNCCNCSSNSNNSSTYRTHPYLATSVSSAFPHANSSRRSLFNSATLTSSAASSSSPTSSAKVSALVENVPSKLLGGGNRVYTPGSGIGSDSSMIAANDRCSYTPSSFHTLSTTNQQQQHDNDNDSDSTFHHHRRSFIYNTSPSLSTAPSSVDSTATATAAADDDGAATSGAMEDEYGEMTADGHTYKYPGTFKLESGQLLHNAELRYQTYGTLNHNRDNVLVVCHALTGNASLHSWWGDLLGPGLAFDTSKYFVVCANILGSCYGSTGPSSPAPKSWRENQNGNSFGAGYNALREGEEKKSEDIGYGSDSSSDSSSDDDDDEVEPYGISFPDVSVQDTVRLQLLMLRDELKIHSIKCVIGGSFGGMQAVEFAAQAGKIDSEFSVDDQGGRAEPFVRSIVPIACGAAHTAWQIAISEVQRQAIYADPKWNNGNPSMADPPLSGLSVARQIGMVSYRTPIGYEKKFGRELKDKVHPPYGSRAPWQVKSYLEYQGYKFLSRFDPITYVKLTEQMDTHDVGRNRGGKKNALSGVFIPALVLGIDSDMLYPLHEQEELAGLFPNAELKVIHSEAGHDGFLLEQDQVANHITNFLAAHD